MFSVTSNIIHREYVAEANFGDFNYLPPVLGSSDGPLYRKSLRQHSEQHDLPGYDIAFSELVGNVFTLSFFPSDNSWEVVGMQI